MESRDHPRMIMLPPPPPNEMRKHGGGFCEKLKQAVSRKLLGFGWGNTYAWFDSVIGLNSVQLMEPRMVSEIFWEYG